MRSGLLLLAFVAAATAVPNITPIVANKELLEKQQHVYYLLSNPLQGIPNKELETTGKTYEIEKFIDKYTDKPAVKWLTDVAKLEYYKAKTLPFTIVRPEFRKLIVMLIRAFTSAVDYPTFLYTACWARTYMPVEYFVPAYLLALLQRKDTKGIMLPAIWDIFPNYFVDSEYIQEAQNIRSMGYSVKSNKTIFIPSHYQYLDHLDYWYKDPGRNAFYYYYFLAAMTDERMFEEMLHEDTDFIKLANSRGLLFLKNIKFFNARESMESISHGLPPFNIHEPYTYKPFKSNLRFINGLEMPGLTKDFSKMFFKTEGMRFTYECEKRIVDAIDSGFVISNQGKLVPIYTGLKSLDILGNMVEGSGRSINLGYYGNCLLPYETMYSGFYGTHDVFYPQPSVFENPATMPRYKNWIADTFGRIVRLLTRWENRLRPYNRHDLLFDGVEVKSFTISKLKTFIEKYVMNLDPATYKSVYNTTDDTVIKTYIPRLNHEPFTFKIVVNSKVPVENAVARIFMKLEHPYYKGIKNFYNKRWEVVPVDQFFVNLNQGETVIERNSNEAPMRGVDPLPQDEIIHRVKMAMDSHGTFHATNKIEMFAFPDRFALPKGHTNGLKVDWFFIISNPVMKNISYAPVPPFELDPFYTYNNYDSVAHDVVTGEDFGTGYLGDKFIHHGARYQRSATESTAGTGFWDKYYKKFHLVNLPGAVISIDGREPDFPFNRPVSAGAFSVPNIKVIQAPIFYEEKEEFYGKYGTTFGYKSSGEHVVY